MNITDMQLDNHGLEDKDDKYDENYKDNNDENKDDDKKEGNCDDYKDNGNVNENNDDYCMVRRNKCFGLLIRYNSYLGALILLNLVWIVASIAVYIEDRCENNLAWMLCILNFIHCINT